MHYSEMDKETTERVYPTDRVSNIDEAMGRCDKASSLVYEAWDTLRNRIDPIVRPTEPMDESPKAMMVSRDVESSHCHRLNDQAARLENLAISIRNVIDRLDV